LPICDNKMEYKNQRIALNAPFQDSLAVCSN
jgi:hypothetical protein